jgi:Recombination endonuclease VII
MQSECLGTPYASASCPTSHQAAKGRRIAYGGGPARGEWLGECKANARPPNCGAGRTQSEGVAGAGANPWRRNTGGHTPETARLSLRRGHLCSPGYHRRGPDICIAVPCVIYLDVYLRRNMPRLRSYWNGKANSLMTAEQRAATGERYAEWVRDRHNNSRQKQNAASVVRARQWALDHPEEAKKRRAKARQARKARRLADPEYNSHAKSLKAKHGKTLRSKPDYPAKKRASDLKPKGWTAALYDKALQEQGELCAICREPFPRTPCADHKHSTPPVPRGLLCNGCNSGIGFLKDSPELLETAAAYLRKFS